MSSEKILTSDEKFLQVSREVVWDSEAADLRITLFHLATSRSLQLEERLKPFPPGFSPVDDGSLEKLTGILEKVPPLEHLLDGKRPGDIEATDFLHWLLVDNPGPKVSRIDPLDAKEALRNFCWKKREIRPNKIFKIIWSDDNAGERKFQEYAKEFPTKYAFHGSKTCNFHSILNYGLAQHLNKRAAFGEGIYLSTDVSVCIGYSPAVTSWTHSQLSKTISCVALCEYIDHPVYVKTNRGGSNKDIPRNFLIVTNNDIIRVRYLLLYGQPRSKKSSSSGSSLTSWMGNNKATVLIVSYAVILLAVTLVTADNSWWTPYQQMFGKYLKSVLA
ncbi:hypothetical protein DMENIID0001_029160 [Sergentomyia squamirostris]